MKNKPKNIDFRVFSIRIKSKKLTRKILSLLYKYRQFENVLLILISQNHDDFKYFTNKQVLRNALLDYNNKNPQKVEYLKKKYKDNQLWENLRGIAKSLKSHNLTYIISKVRANFITYFTNLKSYKGNHNSFTGMPKPPKPKKLSKLKYYSIELDRYTSLSFAKLESGNLIGVNLSNKMVYIHCNAEQVKKLTQIDKLHSARVVYDNGLLYLQISYLKERKQINSNTNKSAGIDIGINNLASIFIDDKNTPSLVISGKPYKYYNSKFNRLVAKLNESKSKEVLQWKENGAGSKYPIEYTEKGKRIGKFISFLFGKRDRYFKDQFHKISKRIVEYLYINEVSDVYISKNLAELKNNGDCKLNKSVKQNFIQIPIIQLLKYIEYKAQEYGIKIHWIDEQYSSKVSCISGDVNSVQNNPMLTNAFNGRRVSRGLFLDTEINKVFNADLNGAVNHIKIGVKRSFIWLTDYLFKVCNPIRIKCDYEFCKFLKGLQNSGSGKSVSLLDTEASYSNILTENVSLC
jgi:IS605 OrfB family transposase